jgi:hypothetical protein
MATATSAGEATSHPGVKNGRRAWVAELQRLARTESASPWLVGDHLLTGERKFGVAYKEAAGLTNLNIRTLYNRVSMSKMVGPDVRRDDLTWAQHRPVQSLRDPAEQAHWLGLAAERDWDEDSFRAAIRAEGERLSGRNEGRGFGAFAVNGGEWPDPEGGEVVCAHCHGRGTVPAEG